MLAGENLRVESLGGDALTRSGAGIGALVAPEGELRRSRLTDLPLVALALSALAWLALATAASTGGGSGIYASSMSVGSSPGSAALFLLAWEIMVIAMMLPTSVGLLARFNVATRREQLRSLRRASLCVGYALAWAWLGCAAALVGETLYRISPVDVWLKGHSSLLAAGLLLLAGSFQFTTLKRRCLRTFAHPERLLGSSYDGGVRSALALGLKLGLACVGCCWALMASMVVLGGGSLLLMMLLTGVMFAERAMGCDDRVARAIGVAAIALGVLVALSPAALPSLAQNAGQWIGMQAGGMHMQMPLGAMLFCRG